MLEVLKEDGFRIARPQRSHGRKFVVAGWCASSWVEGSASIVGRWCDAIDACRAFHRATTHISVPHAILQSNNPYRLCDRAAWMEQQCGEENDLGAGGASLLALRKPLNLPAQLIQGDPSEGNILFTENAPPAIIDIAPYQRPAEYSIAMLLADGVAWSGAPIDLVRKELKRRHFDQLLVRAILFRLYVARLIQRSAAGVERRLAAYAPVIEEVRAAVDAS
ncbi:MAG TPA: hypothetical protein VEK08_15045 [Planctomycetota bacterium]|nr:hypothetical protein [Planctomycetota bacterium]